MHEVEYLRSILARIPGVELVEFKPEEFRRIGSVIVAEPDLQSGGFPDIKFSKDQHLCVVKLSVEITDPRMQEETTAAIEQFRALLAGQNPRDYAPLPIPDCQSLTVALHCKVDGFPVRILRSWSTQHGGYLTSFDAYKPTRVSGQPETPGSKPRTWHDEKPFF